MDREDRELNIIKELIDKKLIELVKYKKRKDFNSDFLRELNDGYLEVQELFDKYKQLISRLTSDTLIDRHSFIYKDFFSDYNNIKDSLTQQINSYELLHNNTFSHSTNYDNLLNESSQLDNSHAILDSTLQQSYYTLNDFTNQGSSIRNSTRKLQQTLSSIPSINKVLSMISARRKRDSIILAILITFLIFFLFKFI